MNEKKHHNIIYLQNRSDSSRNRINVNVFLALSVLFTRSYRGISTGPASCKIFSKIETNQMMKRVKISN